MFVDGFLGYRTSFMLDFVVSALVLIVPLLVWSIWLVRFRRNFVLHRRMQLSLGLILLVAVTAFEVDLQVVHGGWQNIVAKQQLADDVLAAKIEAVRPWLWFHLLFAVTTPFLWVVTIVQAMRRFGNPPVPGPYSGTHRILGWVSTVDITMTSLTGLLFYYLAFVR
jgi:putative membrane protein